MKLIDEFEPHFLAYLQNEMVQDLAHNIEHVKRVVKTAKTLCEQEKACEEIVLPAAYLHDCFSFPKNHKDRKLSSTFAAKKAIQFLRELDYPSQYFNAIEHAIMAHSYSANIRPETLEAQIVQDADRLDALGAIGIARCLQLSGTVSRPLYAEQDPFCDQRAPNDKLYTLDHFYTKLLRLPNSMHTQSARIEAKQRAGFMQSYLEQLQSEIDSERSCLFKAS